MEPLGWVTLGGYFVLMIGIGIYAWRKAAADAQGYMLGGRDLGPGVTALSAGASDMSGWLLMGLPGAVYLSGLSAAWIAIGLFIGAWANYHLVAPRLRTYTEMANDAITIPDFLAERFGGGQSLRVVAAIVIILFFTLYCSAGMVAAGKFAESALGLGYLDGLLMATVAVVIYVLFGGFLAVSLTDFVQGCIMFVGLILVPIVALSAIGGWSELGPALSAAEAIRDMPAGSLTALLAGTTFIGILNAATWGLGYFGQPHIIVRFMAIRSVHDLPTARRINLIWMAVSLAGAVATGLVGAAWATGTGRVVDDPETIFILFANILFHPLITGFLLAAILAAIMSTISSQLLVTASSLAEDIWRGALKPTASEREVVMIGRASVLLVTIISALFALNPDSSILSLVGNAWAGFGAAFGPVILASLWWRGTTKAGALAGMIAGAMTVIIWIAMGWAGWVDQIISILNIQPGALADTLLAFGAGAANWSEGLYEIIPGFAAAALVLWLVSRMTAVPETSVLATFDRAIAATRPLDSAVSAA